MSQTSAINKRWRNIGIFILFLLTFLFVIVFTKVHREKQAYQNALLAAINEKNMPHSFENGCAQVGETTFLYFEQGMLWAKEMDKTADTAYTSFIDPKIVISNEVILIYEYPSLVFYTYYESNFIKREANIPISYITASHLGRFAVLNDLDCKVDVYETDGTLIFSLNSSLPIVDAVLSFDGKHLFLTKISLTEPNTYWLECYKVDKGKQNINETITTPNIPYSRSYKQGWLVWNDTDAYYVTKRGKVKVLNKTT